MLSSDVLQAESGAALDPVRRDFGASALRRAERSVSLSPDVQDAARVFVATGMKAVDALHLASAIGGGADYFCTTDDRLFKKARAANTGATRVVSPADLAHALRL